MFTAMLKEHFFHSPCNNRRHPRYDMLKIAGKRARQVKNLTRSSQDSLVMPTESGMTTVDHDAN